MSTAVGSTAVGSTAVETRPAAEAVHKGFHLPSIDTPVSPVGFGRLVRIETRKQVDTLAGRWFLIVMGLVVAVAIAVMLFVEQGDHSYSAYLQASGIPLAIMLPVLGILSATQEWSQRTAMTTFALEPRRGRIVAAKLTSTVLLGLAAVVVAMVLAAGGRLIADLRGAQTPWDMDLALIGGATLMMVLFVLQGLAFGLAFLNTPAAIVTYFALPTPLPLMTLVSWLQTAYQWIDLSVTTAPLTMGDALTGEQWAKLAVSVALWIGVPLVIGVWRVLRREVK